MPMEWDKKGKSTVKSLLYFFENFPQWFSQ